MKKLFTLFATALMAVGASAQTSTTIASYDNGTMVGTWSIIGTSAANGSLEFSSKYNKSTTSVTTITFPNGATASGAWQYAVKVEGEFKTGDVITIQPFTQMSTDDYTAGKYANILLYYEKDGSPKNIADLTGSTTETRTVTDGHEEEGDPKTFTYTLTSDYTNLFFARGGNTRINLMKVTITRTESESGEGGESTDEGTVIASWDKGTATGETTAWTVYNNEAITDASKQASLNYTGGKIDTNKTTVTAMTFPSSITSGENWYSCASLTGDFKTGDVITVQPFTQMSTGDFTGGTKYANLVIYDADKNALFNTNGTAGAKTVTDGHEEAGEPKTFTYTLENDLTELRFGRLGNTRLNVMMVKVVRPNSTGINTVSAETIAKANVVKKYFDGKQIVIEKAGKKYTIAGTQIK